MGNRDTQSALDYHDATKHSGRSLRTDHHFLDWDNQPLPFKIYPNLEPIALVKNFPTRDVPTLEAISQLTLQSNARSMAQKREPTMEHIGIDLGSRASHIGRCSSQSG